MDRKLPSNLPGIRRKHPSAYRDWTPDEDATLVADFASGDTVAALGRLFGRNPNAVRSRLKHLLDPKEA